MGWGSLVGAVAAFLVVLFLHMLWFGRKNSDPLNRKAAAEICEYLTDKAQGAIDLQAIAEIFMRNARYRAQALHVASMIPILLENTGYPKELAKHAMLRVAEAARMVPK